MQGSVSCEIHPLLLGKSSQSYITWIFDYLLSCYFLRSNNWDKMKHIYQLMISCSSILNSSRRRHALSDDAVEITSYLNTSWYSQLSFWFGLSPQQACLSKVTFGHKLRPPSLNLRKWIQFAAAFNTLISTS